MTQRTPVLPSRQLPSSPRTASSGRSRARAPVISRSDARSLSLTMSVPLDLVPTPRARSGMRCSRRAPALRARATATSSRAAGSSTATTYAEEMSNGWVDLRSDTVTRPDAAMRRAMADAEVGDDVYGEDPTIIALEREVADLFGHAAAVFVPSGTMGNQIALRLVCPAADEIVCDADAHVVSYEGGGAAQHGGIQTRTIVAPCGLLTRELLEPQLRLEGYHTVPTRAVAVEQTHNRGGGAVYPLEQLKDLRALTASYGLAFHCDGAR